MFKKIIAAIDGSEMSEKATEAAILMAKEQGGQVTLLHVMKDVVIPPYAMGDMAYVTREYDEDINEAIRKDAEELLNKGKAKAEADGLAVTTVLRKGDAAREIINYTKENRTDLIVIGSRGLGAFKEIMLGSVSHKVSQLADCPVLIIK
ncbi:universal stress protein [Aneurinibacillus tyrosinisolvens]|uniref:universal stress protein n=1 Tax=Aneurinibacillus tyrosinisolvens TaxID=1443435 RepID=UPI00063F5CF0|nr:universal stress protein [Aneurinibacillus tyrosinisolvens]